MESQKIDMFLISYAKNFPSEKMGTIRSMLEKADDSKFMAIQTVSYKDPTMLLIVSLLAGGMGVDRFILGEVGLGIAKLLTCGGFGIWTIVDWFIIMDRTRDLNFERLTEVLSY